MGEHLMSVKQMLFFDTDGNNVSFYVNVGRTWGEFCLYKNGGSKGTGSWRGKRAIPVLPKLQHPFRRTSKDLSDLLFRKAACQLRTSLGMMLWFRFPSCVIWGWSDTVRSVCMETAGQTGATAARGSDSEREKMLFGFSSWLGSQLKSSDRHTPF